MGRFKTTKERQRNRMKQPYIISNLVYESPAHGFLYPSLFLENQVKSLCDPTNLPALAEKYAVEFALFTDENSLMQISRHPNFMRLSQICPVHVIKLGWPPDADRFGSRYQLLVQMFHQVLAVALEKKAWLSVLVADLVFAQAAVPRILSHLEKGHDAVFMVPIRSSADSVNPLLAKLPRAPTDLELFEMAYANLHHLWTHSTWDNPYFSRMPYSMLWNSGSGLVAHNFGITPIAFKPSEEMKAVKGVIDSDVPAFFKNPYWAHDWTDAPVAGVEPLSNGHYPPFEHKRANEARVAEWAKVGTQPVQAKNLHQPLFYPTAKRFADTALADRAKAIAEDIQRLCKEQ